MLLPVLLGIACSAEPPLDPWVMARTRVRAWTGCELPAAAANVEATDATFVNSIIDARFTVSPDELDRLLECWTSARLGLRPGAMDSSAMVVMPDGVRDLRSVALAYDVPGQHRTLRLELGSFGADRHALRVATVAEGGTPPRGAPGTVLEH